MTNDERAVDADERIAEIERRLGDLERVSRENAERMERMDRLLGRPPADDET